MVFLRQRFDGLGGRYLLVRFGLASAIVVVALGLVLGSVLHRMIERTELGSISQATAFTADFALRGSNTSSRTRLDRRTVTQLGAAVRELRARGETNGLQFTSPLYRLTIGSVPDYAQAEADRDSALAGRDASRRVDDSYVLTVPVVLRGDARPFGALAVAVPAERIDAAIATNARILYLILIGGLGALWLVLLPVLALAARSVQRHADESERLARTDLLTGLPNRASFGEELERLVSAGPVGAMIVDADNFKHVNDTYGHDVGDLVLQSLGTRIRAAVRLGDVVGRLGGDEFGVALDTDDRETLEAVAARIVELAGRPIEARGELVGVRVSVGVAVAATGPDAVQLLRLADDAMIRAKDAGGGRAELGLVRVA
jgi:diguanylate cyclase (GGDEF)-like protein